MSNFNEILEIIKRNRSTSSTTLNHQSSRSHLFINLNVNTNCQTVKIRSQLITFVDLAGSEKLGKTNASKERMAESININKSLSNLGVCLRKIAEEDLKNKNKFAQLKLGANWRNCKLTQLLKNIFSTTAFKTYIITCVSDRHEDYYESNDTLLFASKLNEIKLHSSHIAENEILTK
mmetsp:Transcript_898/g.792  ORF Transcript_898/g.792 Transcript_898/m.792 type:complete len:177 (-) Transcript_898:1713-2243(-)